MEPASGVRRVPLQPHQITDAITAAGELFVLAHLGVPRVDAERWSLTIDGLVERGCTLDLEDLRALPKRTVEAVHHCCGNPIEPTVATRRAANVRWGGADLAALLNELRVDARARYLWSYGLDGGDFANTHAEWFVKDLPVERLATRDVLLAYELNGEPLSAEHGYPVRLVVPGYNGTNSVKWLWRIYAAERRAEGPFTTTSFYNDRVREADIAAGLAAERPVWATAPESIIVAPASGSIVKVGEPIQVWGWAWSFGGIAAVEVSFDDGVSFMRAALEPRRGWAWQRFSALWIPTERGEVTLSARASEAGGATQPREGARNSVHSVSVHVRQQGSP
jgi:DMSO/TMAO reductase YedYZ molybdopterin-dependent catalytic subunit